MSSMIRPMEQFVKTLLAARRVSTPLVAIRTADPALTVARIEEAVGKDAAIVQWDIVRGLVRVNDAGAKEIGKVSGSGTRPASAPSMRSWLPASWVKTPYWCLPTHSAFGTIPKWRKRFGICVTFKSKWQDVDASDDTRCGSPG